MEEKRREEIHKRKESEGGRDCCKLVETHDGRLRHHNNPLVFISLTLSPLPSAGMVTVTDDLLRGATSAHGNTLR